MISLTDFYDFPVISNADFTESALSFTENEQNVIKNIRKVIYELNAIGKPAYIVPLPLSGNDVYWTDYAFDYIKEESGTEVDLDNFVYFTVYLDKSGKNIGRDYVTCHFSAMTKAQKEEMIIILKKYLDGHVEWNGSNTTTMMIHFSNDNYTIDDDALRDDDYYPKVHINMDFTDGDGDGDGVDDWVGLMDDPSRLDTASDNIKSLLGITDDHCRDRSYDNSNATLDFFCVDNITSEKLESVNEYLDKNTDILKFTCKYSASREDEESNYLL
jgi:hypothetical protein